MNFNFTSNARAVLENAREEALRLGHDYVGTEHQLLGIVAHRSGAAVATLLHLGVDMDRVREQVEKHLPPGQGSVARSELPYTSRARKVLEYSMFEARELRHAYVGTEHLLLGLLREERSVAAAVLNQLGIFLPAARQAVLHVIQNGAEVVPEAVPRMPERFRVEVDDASDLPIYEQIVARVQEAVATRRLRPGERLPTVRQLADQLEIAPGTVARAYGELERLGVVVTEGARGTRVAERREAPLLEAQRPETLVGLLRPVAVAAFHLGATATELRAALDEAMRGIYREE